MSPFQGFVLHSPSFLGLAPQAICCRTFGTIEQRNFNKRKRGEVLSIFADASGYMRGPQIDCTDHSLVTASTIGEDMGVQLQAEDKLISADGRLTNATGPKPSKAAQLYTASFTARYPEIAAVNPVYAQLSNQIDLLIAAAFIRQQDYYGRVSWDARLLMDESQLPTETLPNSTKVDCAIYVLWKGNRLLCPAGGGVSIQADEALLPKRLIADEQGELSRTRGKVEDGIDAELWRWD